MNDPRPIGFLDYVAHGGSIEKLADGVRCHYLPPGQPDFVLVDFAEEELRYLDARLPIVLMAMFEKVRHPTIPVQTIFTNWLSTTLQHWYNPLVLTDYSGVMHNVADIVKIDRVDHQYEVVRLTTTCYTLQYVEGIPYSSHTNVLFLTLGYDELNKQFPGWRTRYDALTSLDAEMLELVTQVYPRKPVTVTPDVSLADVNFH